VQVDQCGVFGGATAGLVQALAIQAQGGAAGGAIGTVAHAGEPTRGGVQVGHGQAADLGHGVGGVVAHQCAQRFKAFGVGADIGLVDPAFGQHDVQQPMKEHDVAARLQWQVEVGQAGGVGAARVGDDDLHVGACGLGFFDAAKQHRVCPGGVAADDEQAVGVAHVVVAGGWCVGTQRELVAGHGAAHAQARVGVDVVATDQAFDQLVEDVIVLGQQLATDVKAHRVGAVRAHGGGQPVGGQVECRVPADGLRRFAPAQALQGLQQAHLLRNLGARGQVQGGALGAQAAEIGGVIGVAAHLGDLVTDAVNDDPAADAAVRAGRARAARRWRGGGGVGQGAHRAAPGASCVQGVRWLRQSGAGRVLPSVGPDRWRAWPVHRCPARPVRLPA